MRKLKLFLTLLMLMCIGVTQMWAEETEYYSYTFSEQQFSDNTTAATLGDITWTPATSWSVGTGYWGYADNKGQQWGSGSHTLNTMTLTAGTSIDNVSKIVVNAAIASSGGCNLSVKVGDTSVGSTQALTTTATNYTFTCDEPLSGVVSIILSNGSKKKAQYIKSITIYTDESETPPANPYTVSFSTGSGNGAVTAITENPAGAGITLPAGPTSIACDGWSFAGWAEAAVASETTTAPTLLAVGANYKPVEDCTLYAVYSRTESGSGGGVEDKSKTEGFETKATSTTYNGTVTINTNESDCGIGWSIYYGTVSTNDKIAGSNSAQMRWYSSAKTNIPYAKTTTAISGLQSVNFKARVSSTDVKVSLWYSTDGENWTISDVNQETFAAASTAYDFSATINGEVGAGYYVKIGEDGGTAPSSSSVKLIIDAVTFNYQEGSGSSSTTYYLSTPTCSTPTCEKLGTPTVTVPAANLTYNSAKLTWEAVTNAVKYVVKFAGTDHETTDLFYDATGLDAATNYSYQVKAVAAANQDAYCDGDFSASANFTTLAAPALAVDPASKDFGTVATDASVSQVFSVSGSNLQAGTLSISVPSGYSVSPSSISVTEATLAATEVTVSKNTTTAAEYNGNMTISGCGLASAVEVALSMTVAEKYTVKFNTGAGNPTQADITEENPGAGITLPAGPTPKCSADGWVFAGWAKVAVNEETTTAPTLLSGTYNPETNNEMLYAVYSKSEGGSTPGTLDYTITFDDNSTDASSEISESDFVNYITNNADKVSSVSDIVKCYKGATGLKISSKKNNGSFVLALAESAAISKVVLNTKKKSTTQGASFDVTVGSTAFSTSSELSKDNFVDVEFTGTKTTSNSLSIASLSSTSEGSDSDGRVAWLKSITIYYEEAVTYNYISAPTCCDKHAISIADNIENGSVSADLASACEGATVTLTVTPATNYHLKTLSVMNGETPVAVTENTFSMPAAAVTVSAEFEEDECTPLATPEVTVSGKAYPYDAVKLAWTGIDHANKYKVYIYDNEDNELEHNDEFAGVEYTIGQTLSAGTTYKYSVQAISNTPAVHCPSEIATSSFVTDALPTAHLTLIDAAGEHASSDDYTILTAFNLPNAAAVPQGCPKVFRGWDADENCNHAPAYAPGVSFTFENTTGVTLHAVYAKEGAPAPVTYPIDFEANADTYTDWTLTNITSKQEDSGVNPHEGEYFGVTAGTATASLVTKEKIANPTSLTVFVSKKSTNTSASTWYAQVSEDGTNWTDVESVNGASMSKGAWVELSADLSAYSDVYVRVYYSGSTAVRCIDDLVLNAIGPKTYSEYSTECEACKAVSLVKAGEDQQKGNTFALKVGEDVVASVQTCEATTVTIVPTVATGYQVSFAINELEGASLSENTISLAADAEGELTVTATYSQINHKVVLAQTPEIGATLSGATEEAHYGATINLSATNIPEGYEFTGWTPADLFASAEAAAAANTSFTMPNNDVTVTANFAKKYTVTFNVDSDPITEESVGAGVTLPEGPAPSAACVTAGWAFAGWAEAAVASETPDAQTLYTGEYHPTKDITLYAVYSRTESGDAPAKPSYVEANYADLVSGDAIVITNDNYAMSTVKASKGQPVATAVTVEEKAITSSVEGLVWDITKGEENFSLTVHGGSDKLYSTNTNNGLRIGTEDNYLFNITDNYLFNIGTSRYAGVYNSEDWRNYETINSNIENQTLAFYKAVSTSSSTTYYWSAPECCTPHNVTIADNIEHGTVVANPTSACADATITVALTPAEGYELTAWTVDGTEQALNATTFTMPNKAVEVSATFSEIVTPAADATLKLMENGNEVTFAGNHKVGDVVNLPSALSDEDHACEGKVLKGWSTEVITTPVAAKPTGENFYELGAEYTIATAADVLYAVFAEEVPGATNTTNIAYAGSTANMTGNNDAATFGLDANQWSVVGAKNNASNNVGLNKVGDIRLYGAANGGSTLTITAPQTITSVELTLTTGYTNAYVEVGGNQVSAVDGVYPINATSFVIGNANTNTTQVRMTNIAVNFTSAGSVANYATSCVAPLADPQFSVEGGEYTEAQTIELSAAEGTIYYTLDGKNPTSASTEYTEPIALNTCGTTTIKAIAISATNHSAVVSAEYAIAIPIPTVSAEFPYTAEQAIAVYDGGCYNNEDVYVTGTVQTATLYNSGSYTVTLTNGFQFYYFYKAAGNEQFTAQDDVIGSGDVLVACGKLSKHNTTYQLASGCYLVSREAYTAPKTPIANEQENPYTVEQAIAFCNDGITYDLSDEVYVKGVVVAAPNSYGTFDIHDPELNEPTFQIFSGALSDALENAGVEIEANDTIIAHGQIKMHGSKPEMEGGIVVEVKKYVAPIVPEFTVNPTAVAFGNVEQNAPVGAIELNVGLTAIANATVTLADENNVFSIDKTALTETGVVTVSVVSTATVGNYAATITLHDVAEAAENVVVNVTMNVTAVDPRHKAQDIDGFDATSGNLNSDIAFASVQGDGTAVPALQSNGSILYYQPASGKAAGGYMTLTAVHGCKIDQVKVVTATHATNIKYSKDGGELSEASDEIEAGEEYLTPALLDAETVNIYCAGADKTHRLYIAQVVVYYTGEAIPVHHKAIDITGMEASQFEFPKNGTFTHAGLKVYACYDENCDEKVEITADCHVEADLTTTGEKKAKVYYGEELVDEYDINVIAGQENPALAYTPTSETIAAANVASWSAPAFSNPLNVSPISFSSNNTAVATVDENGVIALAGGYGTAKITASFEETEDYIASEATYTITIQEPVNKIDGDWRLVTSTADITVGSKVIIVGTKNNTKYAMGEQKPNNRAAVAVVSEDATSGVIEPAEGTKTFTLVDAGDGMYAFKANNGKYLYAAGSTYLREQAMINGNASWTITITSGGTTIEANGTNSNKSMRMNPNGSNAPLFSSYASGQNAVTLYVNRTVIPGSNDPEHPADPVIINTNVEEEEIVANGNVIVTVNTDNFDEPKSYIAQNGATIIINGNGSEEAKSVVADEQSTIRVNQPTTVNQVFSVAATMGAGLSGQITGVDNVTIAASTEAYFDITLGDNANPDKWHAIAVPFPVDAINGIYDAVTGEKLANEVNYAIMDYHGDIRATGAYGWKKFRGIMTPGVFYLMTVDGNTKTFRFKMSGVTLPTATSLALQLFAASGDGQSTDAGWNGVANPTLQHGTVNQTVLVLNPTSYTYEDHDAGSYNFVVGTPFFIQANAAAVATGMQMGDVAEGKPYYAPKRASENGFENIKVFFGNDEYKDKLTISANVEALNEYQIGKDLVKMTMTNTPSVAQIFGNAYNAKLCRVYAPMANDQAEYSLTLYAPNAGEYTISAPEMEDADIFLTYEGSIIWNLSMSEYTNDFAKGNNEGYGLILVKKAPQVITGVDNAEANEAGVQKVIINDHVYILRAEQMYDVTGKMVK